ncbi:hypothetical protein [Actinomadura verrucosospora]|uniref:hypothetical protein n=1 Tax=Actinomadura verrucosospora TaxID=46165 RepID=UPI001C207C30|nr:hypothetical protein [Actinomadura verrucosospora]
MAIDASGEWWRGESAADLAGYLEELAAGGYLVGRVVEAVCAGCGGQAFRLRADCAEGAVERSCVGCGQGVLMLDSAEYWSDAEPEAVVCPCGADVFDVAVGFSMRPDDSVRWISVGIRCVADGVLGRCADWKIDHESSRHLLATV